MARSLKARLSDESCTAVDIPISPDMVSVSSDDDLSILPVSTAPSSSASRADVLALYMGEVKSQADSFAAKASSIEAKSLADSPVRSFAAKASSIEAKRIEYITAEGLVRLSGSGILTKPDGFATAQFPGEQLRVCEMTNLALPSAVVLKRPAAQPKSLTLKSSASALVAGTGDKYKVMFYRRAHTAAIRRNWGAKQQIFQFGDRAHDERQLRNIAAEGVAGSPETVLRAFVLERLAANTAVDLDGDIVSCEDE